MPRPASQLYAKNLENLLGLMITEEGRLNLDFEDDIVAAARITRRGDPRRGQPRRSKTHPSNERAANEPDDRDHDLRPRRLRRLRGDLKVPTKLHTPLMSQTNAIHGIVMLGGADRRRLRQRGIEYVIGTIAIAFGTINVVGGFMVTDRMLGCSRARSRSRATKDRVTRGDPAHPGAGRSAATALYIVAFSLFIIGVEQGTHPSRPNAAT